MTTFYENKRQAAKVRIVLWGVAGFGAAFAALGIDIVQSWGLRPADGGVLKPLWQRAAFGGSIGLFGFAAMAGMLVYTRLYVVRLVRTGTDVVVETMTPFATRRRILPASAFAGGREHKGRLTLRQSIRAPWLTLRTKDTRLPYLIDLQAETIGRNELEKLGCVSEQKKGGGKASPQP